MSKYLKAFETKKVAAAMEEILADFQNTLVEYQGFIFRLLGVLRTLRNPESELNRTDCPQQVASSSAQQLCEQDMDIRKGQEEPELPQVKMALLPSSPVEPCTSQEREERVFMQETAPCMWTPPYEENHHCEGQALHMKPGQSAAQEESVDYTPVLSAEAGAANSDPKHSSEADDVTQHTRTHTNEKHYEFKTCGEHFTLAHFESHTRMHTGEKSYGCKTCGRHFRQASNLTRHMRIHTGEKQYECKNCGGHFTQAADLKSHTRIHTGEKPYECMTCGRHFSQSSNLTRHMRIHTGEKPYGCETCGKHFRNSGILKQHVRIHTGEKPYECKTCGKHFAQSSTLMKHMRSHTGEKPYECNTCGKHFILNSTLMKHMRSHIGEKPHECQT